MDTRSARAGKDTRLAIVEAGLRGFGEKGFAATSTREIAALAGTNIASISYHFGGKEGLRDACAAHIVKVMQEATAGAGTGSPPTDDPEAARDQLAGFVAQMAHFLMLRPEARLIAGFIMREMAEPSSALDTIYEGLFLGVHTRVCALWGTATGREAESAGVKLAVFSAIGQVLYFHLGRPIVQRRLGWDAIGPDEAHAIAETARRTLLARLDADRRSAP
jgi:AcrR family transcriptional regulator